MPVDVVGKSSDIEPFEIAGNLHNANTHDIGRDQHQHLVEGSCATQEINQLSCHFSLKPGACKKSQIIDETGNRNKKENFPFFLKVREHPVRAKGFILHRCCLLLLLLLLFYLLFHLKFLKVPQNDSAVLSSISSTACPVFRRSFLPPFPEAPKAAIHKKPFQFLLWNFSKFLLFP